MSTDPLAYEEDGIEYYDIYNLCPSTDRMERNEMRKAPAGYRGDHCESCRRPLGSKVVQVRQGAGHGQDATVSLGPSCSKKVPARFHLK